VSGGNRSFWSSIPGVVTGLAGLLTAIVGMITLLVQLDVIGGDSSDSPSTPTTAPASGGGAGGGAAPAAEVPTFTLTPATLEFKPTDPRRKDVTVKNTSTTTALTVPQPRLTGTDSRLFSASFGTCTGAPLAAGLSCTLTVTFAPSGPLANYSATLEVAPSGARAEVVQIKASSIL
jgi:hypothetical protein